MEANPQEGYYGESVPQEERFALKHDNKPFELVQAERRLKLFRADRDSLDEELDIERREEMQERVDVEKQTIEELSTPEESLAESVVKAPVRATKTVAQAGVDATKTVAGATKTVAQAGADVTIAVATAPLKGAKALTDAVGLTTKTEEEPEEGEPEVGMAVDLDGDGIPDAFLKKNGWKRDKNGRIRNKGKFVKVDQLEKAKEENLSPRKPKLKTKR